jgi:hypothetical protein
MNEANNLGDVVVDRETEQDVKPVADPFFDNTEKLTPRRHLEAELEKWKRRALAFQEGYRDKAFEVTALELQLLDLRALGVDKVTARINESLRTKLLATAIQRNELKDALKLAAPHVCSYLCPSVKRTGEEWTHTETCQAITTALNSGLESAKRPISDETNHGQASETKSS